MTPEFLREEAARFRGMAETVDREASKLRLLAMAADYEAKAAATAEGPAKAIKLKAARKIAGEQDEGV